MDISLPVGQFTTSLSDKADEIVLIAAGSGTFLSFAIYNWTIIATYILYYCDFHIRIYTYGKVNQKSVHKELWTWSRKDYSKIAIL